MQYIINPIRRSRLAGRINQMENKSENNKQSTPKVPSRGDFLGQDIQLRSEKVRHIIGQVPPVLIRTGNLLIFVALIVLLSIGCFVKSPVLLRFNVEAVECKNGTEFMLVSTPQAITSPIPEGCIVRIYKKNTLLFTGKLEKQIDSINISNKNIHFILPMSVPDTIVSPDGIKISLSNNVELQCEVELENKPIIKKIFRWL